MTTWRSTPTISSWPPGSPRTPINTGARRSQSTFRGATSICTSSTKGRTDPNFHRRPADPVCLDAHADSDAHGYRDANDAADSHSDSDSNPDSESNTAADAAPHSHFYPDSHSDSDSNPDSESNTAADAAPHSHSDSDSDADGHADSYTDRHARSQRQLLTDRTDRRRGRAPPRSPSHLGR